ncbi:ribosome recycling factor [Candidatus Falkowbacteria bacterium HGW-Falkowbacteria-1]|uniref:Ribosome-recycling factor n=1 Tax=Candidatus Falkowbacteria bacterium HGW-Falkowbacteria-1 TaxID=2013768 RepID=A0A2N2EAS5_9BACT|nr:MAG: ribosome recycling factor [Candidatus Falkowbacteria bacterium HGW-Falkowbacteria-1]
MNIYIQNKRNELDGSLDFFKKDLLTVKVGRANPAMLEGVFVEAYGVKNPLNAVCNIAVSDSRSMTLTPWDKAVTKSIEKGIIEANLGVGVLNDGDKIRINIPQMTEENRKEAVKKVNEKQEKARVSIRQIRDEIKSSIEEAFDSKEIGEDDKFRFIKDLDEEVERINSEIKEMRDRKEVEIMEI